MIDFSDRQGRTYGALHLAPARGKNKPALAGLLAEALATRFTVLEEVYASDFSTVFLAEEIEYGRLVQLEVLSNRAAADAEQVELFYQEAEAAAHLQHPHIVRAAAAAPLAATHFRLTAQVRGAVTLRESLADQGWLEIDRTVQVITQVAHALEYAHQLGVLHLNLQPENVLLDTNGEVVVCGFGLKASAELQWARDARARQCPASYLSPEQLSGADGDRASDLYALGVMLYEVLTDRVPFDSDDLAYLKHRQQIQAPQAPHHFRPELPRELSGLVMALLARSPEARAVFFSSAASFSAALKRSCEAQTAAAPASSLAARVTNPLPLDEISAEVMAANKRALVPPRADNEWLLRKIVYCLLHLEPVFSKVPARALVFPLFVLLLLWAAISSPRSGVPTGTQTSASKVEQAKPANQAEPAPDGDARGSEQTDNTALAAAPVTSPASLPALTLPANILPSEPFQRPSIPLSAFPRPSELLADESEPRGPEPLYSKRRRGQVRPAVPFGNLRANTADKVAVEMKINRNGQVMEARALSGPPALRQEAEAEARNVKFKPARLFGKPFRAVKKFFTPRSSRRQRR